MRIDVKQYLADINIDEISSKNVILCKDSENRDTLLIRNANENNDYVTFENKFFVMKNNVFLFVNDKTVGNFHILICKKNDEMSVQHFRRVCHYLFIKNNSKISSEEMLKLFYSLERIFSESGKQSPELEIGLYGELALINYMYENNCIHYNKWHGDFFSKHDFELNKKTKLEVKITIKEIRKHTFGHDQIYRSNLDVFVVSCILKRCEKGVSLFELCKQTINILNDSSQMLAIELLMKKLGLSENYTGINCILEDVYDNINLYNAKDIPHLIENIPDGVSNIHYDIDLSNIASCNFEILNKVGE